MRLRKRCVFFFAGAALLVVASCDTGSRAPATLAFAPGETCDAGTFRVSDDFPGSRRGDCIVRGAGSVELFIHPEDPPPINDSPWYAFRIESAGKTQANVTLRYVGGHHRYPPKRSVDGKDWQLLGEEQLTIGEDRESATFNMDLTGDSLLISAQELILPSTIDAWAADIDRTTDAEISELGRSKGGLPIHLLRTGAETRNAILLVGRQHPAEVTGSIAMTPFVETLLSDSALAREFRQRYSVFVIPLLNPDGVVAGHWRHNLGSTDLNRDWGPFRQPETQLVRDLLDRLDEEGKVLRLFVDFHSTDRNLMYTQMDDEAMEPAGFTNDWVTAAMSQLDDYEFTQERRAVSDTANGKNYMYKRYGIPSVTFEVGDDTDREVIERAAKVFAVEMMRLLNEFDERP